MTMTGHPYREVILRAEKIVEHIDTVRMADVSKVATDVRRLLLKRAFDEAPRRSVEELAIFLDRAHEQIVAQLSGRRLRAMVVGGMAAALGGAAARVSLPWSVLLGWLFLTAGCASVIALALHQQTDVTVARLKDVISELNGYLMRRDPEPDRVDASEDLSAVGEPIEKLLPSEERLSGKRGTR